MIRTPVLAVLLSMSGIVYSASPDNGPAGHSLSATEIINRNVAARGGLEAWRAVQTLSLAGKLGAGGNRRATLPVPASQKMPEPLLARPAEEVYLPFVMELKRPRKMRFELQFNGQTALQIYDGSNGWKLRPFLNRRVVEPYTTEEAKIASLQADLDGPLVDYAAKGTKVELVGTEKVDNRDTYKLKLTFKTGATAAVWIDSQTFLETKIQGQPRRLDGIEHPVEVYFLDYRPANGLQIPFTLETLVLPVDNAPSGLKDVAIAPEKTIIEKVVVNPKLDETLFSKPDPSGEPASKQK